MLKKRDATAEKIALLMKIGVWQVKERTVAVTTEDMQKRRNDVKARTTLLLALPDEHQLRFSKYNTAQELWAAILKTFEGSKTLEQTFNRLQAIVSHLEFMEIEIEQDDLNQKFLTSLAPEWLMHTIVWRNRSDLDTMSLDDLYNHLKVYEPKVQKKSESNSQNLAFISSANNNSGNEEVNTATSQSNGSQIKYEDINQINEDDIEDMDIKWNMALLSMRANRLWKKTGKKISIQGTDVAGFDKSKVEYFNCHKIGHFARECRAPRSQDIGRRNNYRQWSKNHALVADKEAPTEFALMAKSSSDNKVFDNSLCSKACKKNNDGLNSKITELSDKLSDTKNTLYHYKLGLSQVKARLVEFRNQEIKFCEKIRGLELKGKSRPRNNTHKSMPPRVVVYKNIRSPMRTNRPNMNVAQPKRTSFYKPAHSYLKRPFQRTSAGRSQFRGPRVSITNRKFSTVNRKFPTVNRKLPTGNSKLSTTDLGIKEKAVKASSCWIWKPIQNSTNKGPNSNSVSGNSQIYIDDKGYWDSGCSWHMTGKISYLLDYEPFDGGYVSFGQGGCKITGKETIKTGKLEFENVYFVKDLKPLSDECMLWHRRLGHLNIKTMNRLVRHNLVRGLPSKCFDNDHTCVACLKGKQHKASCKTKLVNSVTKPLHTLHMDLFGPTSTKDETSGILRNFITEIENLKDLKVKIIRCDNGGEFRNKEMNDFCSRKGIKREFSNARTPHQNGVAEKRNRTLIEAARTMLADAKLPVTFWAEAINTACYVQNRVLV
nr:putative ribonuclease H-like domain-containing protein [Tanacetum cinerariifolium]